MQYIKSLLLALAAGGLSISLHAQSPATEPASEGARVGVAGTVDILFHRSEFHTLPGIPSCCSNYPSGTGLGFSTGVLYEYSFAPNWFVGGRFDYQHAAAKFRDTEPTTFIVNGHATDAAFGYRLDAAYSLFALEPTISYRLFNDLPGHISLMAHAGIGLGLKASTNFSQKEEIVAPAGVGLYTDGDNTVRNVASGGIPQSALVMADARLGLGLEAPLNRARTISVAPELWYSFGITPVVHSISWRADALRVGLTVRYALPHAAPPPADSSDVASGH